MDRGKLRLCETPGCVIVKPLNNLPLHLKKILLSKCIWGGVNRRCSCADKERSRCLCKVGVNWSVHSLVCYLVTWNVIRNYILHSGICQANWDFSGITTRYFDYRQPAKKPFDPLFREFLGPNTFFYWTLPRGDKLSDLTTGRKLQSMIWRARNQCCTLI